MGISVFAQTNFEGTIKYSVKFNGKEKGVTAVTLKYPYMKIYEHEHFVEEEGDVSPEKKTITLVDFAKEKSFEIDDSIKAAMEEGLNGRKTMKTTNYKKDTSLNKLFLENFTGTGYTQEIDDAPDAWLGIKNIKLWYANELYFSIPKEQVNYMPFDLKSSITNGKNICLGTEINFSNGKENYEIFVTEISPGTINESVFIIPSNYKIMNVDEFYDYEDSLRDTQSKSPKTDD